MHVYDQALTFILAHPHAFTPRVIELDIPFTSTPPEPSAAKTAATGFAGRESAAFGTSGGHRSGNRRLGDFCGVMKIVHRTNMRLTDTSTSNTHHCVRENT